MILRALTFAGSLDVSAPEVIEGNEEIFFRKTVVTGDQFTIPDLWYNYIPNIKNAVNLGLLEILEGNPDGCCDSEGGGEGDVTAAGNNTFTGTNTFAPDPGATTIKDTSGNIAITVGTSRLLKDSAGNTIFNFGTQATTIATVSGGDVQDDEIRIAFNDLLTKLKAYGIIAS